MTTDPTQLETPGAPAGAGAIEITRHWNSVLTRWTCDLCGGHTEKQDRHYQIQIEIDDGHLGGEIICDQCGEHPDQIPARMREYAARLRQYAERNVKRLEHNAQCHYVRNPAGDDPEEANPFRRGGVGLPPVASQRKFPGVAEPGEEPF